MFVSALFALATLSSLAPTAVEGHGYDTAFAADADYDAAIPTPADLLGEFARTRAAPPEAIVRALERWAEASPRVQLVEYARSHEGRPLVLAIVSSPENLARLDAVRAGMARLADPRELSSQEGERLVNELPAVAWLAYSIHGNETSGSDAAAALVHHLAAARAGGVPEMLDDMVVLIDPMMNPDGRARHAKQNAEHRGSAPDFDDQSLLHTGYWPYGRMNHYLFDLNRDWIFGVHPETRGRMRAVRDWNPLLFVDAHEMYSQDTFLFSPPREPVNPFYPPVNEHWQPEFARGIATAFDRRDWLYYTGEWNEGWYPGYADAWAAIRGAVGMLYEQARVSEDAVRRADGGLLAYRESVHHQLAASLANLRTLNANGKALRAAFLAARREAVSASGPFASRTFAIPPSDNRSRQRRLLELLSLHGIEVHEATRPLEARVTDQFGRRGSERFPAGTLFIPNRQPEGHLVAALLDFDPRIATEALRRERESLLKRNESRIYDVTAWNLTMLADLRAYLLPAELPAASRSVSRAAPAMPPDEAGDEERLGWVFDGADDAAPAAAARLMEEGTRVRFAEKPFRFGGTAFGRGSILALAADQRGRDVAAAVGRTADDVGAAVVAIATGWGEGDDPDLGGSHFRLLEPPRIALLARGSTSPYDVGALWHLIDQRLGIRHSQLDEEHIEAADLRRYNVIVLPDRYGDARQTLPAGLPAALKAWVEQGGTLVAIGSAAVGLTKAEPAPTGVRELSAVLGRLPEYELAVLREFSAGVEPDADVVWDPVVAGELDYPWQPDAEREPLKKDELARRDAWQRRFMPQGAILAARVDTEHWLTAGTGAVLPVLYGAPDVLMAGDGQEAPVRLGVFEAVEAHPDEDEPPPATGWALLPEGQQLRLRMAGLLWPEAAHRLANGAWLTREAVGRGQIILFATPPVFRGATDGTARLFINAIVMGPGMGATAAIH